MLAVSKRCPWRAGLGPTQLGHCRVETPVDDRSVNWGGLGYDTLCTESEI